MAVVDPSKPHPGLGLLYELHYNQSGDASNVLSHVLGHWRVSSLLHDLVFLPAITAASSQLMGEVPIRFWHDQLFCKPPATGGNVAWHQDYSYWTRSKVRPWQS